MHLWDLDAHAKCLLCVYWMWVQRLDAHHHGNGICTVIQQTAQKPLACLSRGINWHATKVARHCGIVCPVLCANSSSQQSHGTAYFLGSRMKNAHSQCQPVVSTPVYPTLPVGLSSALQVVCHPLMQPSLIGWTSHCGCQLTVWCLDVVSEVTNGLHDSQWMASAKIV